jgi:hypothetical protein
MEEMETERKKGIKKVFFYGMTRKTSAMERRCWGYLFDYKRQDILPVVGTSGVINGLVLDQGGPDLLGLLPTANAFPRRATSFRALRLALLESELEMCSRVVHHTKFATSVGLNAAMVNTLSNPSTIYSHIK